MIAIVTLFCIACSALVLLVMVQKSRGGLGILGGAGADSVLGHKTGDALTVMTSVIFGVVLLVAIMLNMKVNAQSAPTAPSNVSTPASSVTASTMKAARPAGTVLAIVNSAV